MISSRTLNKEIKFRTLYPLNIAKYERDYNIVSLFLFYI